MVCTQTSPRDVPPGDLVTGLEVPDNGAKDAEGGSFRAGTRGSAVPLKGRVIQYCILAPSFCSG